MANKNLLKLMLLATLSLLISISAGELIIRRYFDCRAKITFKGDPISEPSRLKLSEDPVLLYELKNPAWQYDMTVGKDERLIVIVGDSISFGSNVDTSKRYSEILNNLLNNYSGKYKYKVINAAVPGYNFIQEVRLIENKFIGLRPYLIIIGYCSANDRTRKRQIIKYRDGLYCSDVDETQPYILNIPFNGFLLSHSAFYRFANLSLIQYFRKINAPIKVRYHDFGHQVESLIGRIAGIAHNNNTQLLFLVFPLLHEGSETSPADSSIWLMERLNKYGIPHINLRLIYEKIGYDKIRINAKDFIHPGELGHKIAAEQIFNYLKEKGNYEEE